MTENKTRKPYVRPSMEVINVEPTSILAGSGPVDAQGINGGMWHLDEQDITSVE